MIAIQALQLGQDANSPCGVFNGQRCQMCLSSDPLHKIMERLSNPGMCTACSLDDLFPARTSDIKGFFLLLILVLRRQEACNCGSW